MELYYIYYYVIESFEQEGLPKIYVNKWSAANLHACGDINLNLTLIIDDILYWIIYKI